MAALEKEFSGEVEIEHEHLALSSRRPEDLLRHFEGKPELSGLVVIFDSSDPTLDFELLYHLIQSFQKANGFQYLGQAAITVRDSWSLETLPNHTETIK